MKPNTQLSEIEEALKGIKFREYETDVKVTFLEDFRLPV